MITDSSGTPLVSAPTGSGVAFVTGAGGFIGGRVAAAFKASGWRVAAFGPGAALPGASYLSERLLASDDLEAAVQAVGGPALLVHAAGPSSVGRSVTAPAEDFERTMGSLAVTLAFLRAAAPEARLIFPSSAAVYGAGHARPITETDALHPASPYGLHKRLAEELIAGWSAQYGLKACCVRLFSIYGAGNRKQLPWDIVQRLKARPAALRLSGAGDERRDYLHVDDVARLFGLLAVLEANRLPPVLNGGTGVGVTVAGMARAIIAASDLKPELAFNGEVRAGDPPFLVADVSNAAALGFRPQVDFDEGVATFVRWAETT